MKKVAIITGASSGIGKAVVQKIDCEYHLILCGRNREALEEVGNALTDSGKTWETEELDLNNIDSIKNTANRISKKYQRINLLFNNAGVSQRSLAGDTSSEVEKKIFQINYFGPVLLTKLLLPNLRLGKSRIAITSSIVGKFGYPLRSSYSAAKHALHGYFESLRLEEFKNGIFVQLFVIGRVNTQISVNAIDENGEKHGKLDKGQANGISAISCAEKICSQLLSEKKEVYIGGKELLMVKFKKYLPFLFYKIASKEQNNV